jgi:hypothetical protein
MSQFWKFRNPENSDSDRKCPISNAPKRDESCGWDTFLHFAFPVKNEVLNPTKGERCDPLGVGLPFFTVFLYPFDPHGVAYL